MTHNRFSIATLLWLCLPLRGILGAENQTLPTSFFNNDNSSWLVTVPPVWNFTTILEATNDFNVTNFTTPYPAAGVPYLVYVNGTYSGYASNALSYSLQQEFNTSTVTYSDQTWTLPVVCEWPISGMYSRLNRILYYVALVFALVVRHHDWLVAGALASATTYSGSAAIQAWVQFGVVNSKKPRDSAGDNDNEAIMGILAAALLMAVPLINWSRTLRRLQTRPLLIYWAVIVFVGYLLVIIGKKETAFSNGWERVDGGIMTCNTRERLPEFKDLGFISHDFITRYNCDDACYNPKTQQHPFHDKSSVIARLDCEMFTWTTGNLTSTSCFTQCPRDIADDCFVEHDGWTKKDFDLENIGYYVILPVAIFELFFVLCFGRKSPEEIRDHMFQFLVGKRMMGDYRALPAEKRKRFVSPSTGRVRLAQCGGLVFYFFAALTYLVCIPFFIFSITWQERLSRFFPDAENYNEVGQWLPWVTVILVLGAAVVGKYHHTWHVYIAHYIFGQKKRKSAPVTKVIDKSSNVAGWLHRSTCRTRSRLYLEWRDLRDFCLHPFWLVLDVDRDRTSDHPTVKYSFSGGLPYPEKQWRHAKDHYQGPWIKDDATWKNFNVEFFIEADDRTLQSWENYQRRVDPTVHPDEHIVYSVLLPPVPCYPDKRTVLANSDEVLIEEKATPNPNAPNTGLGLTDAIVPGARRASTMSFGLQALPNQTYRNNSVPSTISSGAAKTPSLEKNNTFVVETQIPPSRMSSIHPPVSPILSADPSEDPSIPSVPLLSRQGEDQPAMVRPVLASSKNHATQRSGLDDTAAVSQPLLSRTHTNESAASN